MATCTYQKSPEDGVIQQLKELFGSVLNLDVIQNVAVSCQYDVMKSSNKLLEITNRMDHKDNKMGDNEKSVTFGAPSIPNSFLPLSNSSSTSSLASNKSRKATEIDRTISYIQQNFKVLVLMRGLPGSGKSTLARKILETTIGYDGNRTMHLLSTDEYFCNNKLGTYKYDVTKLETAHGWNQNRAFQSMSRGFSPVIIDNTNVQMWEMKPYATMATDYGYIIEILEPDTHWCFDDRELSKRNTHGVPRSKIKDMLERYEKNITGLKLLAAYNLYYKLQKPPQLRLYPPPDNIATTNKNKQNSSEHSIKPEIAASLNLQTEPGKQKEIPLETINLMDFDDEVTTKSLSARDTTNGTSPIEPNPVDKILMCSNDTGTTKVLQPQPNESDTENALNQSSVRSVFNAWGVDEKALRSWDFVTPIKDEGNIGHIFQTPVEVNKAIMVDAGTSTDDECFQLLKNINVGSTYINGIKILDTLNRDINRSTPQRTSHILKKSMLDKSCMTEDVYEDYENHVTQLESLFPDVPSTHLQYWYKKCRGDLEWTIEFLLEAKDEISTLIETENAENEKDDKSLSDEDNNSSSNQPFQVKEKKRRNQSSSEESNNLKKLIESKIDINSDHYSEHLRKIKNRRKTNSDSQVASTFGTDVEESERQRTSSNESSVDDSKEELVDSDIEVDEIDVQKSPKMEETIELNLGEHFVAQLEQKFGEPSLSYPKGFQPVVQMPASLARQLYTFYLESVYQQMDNQKQILEEMAKEDEEFAKKLQASELEESKPQQPQPTPNLHQIMEGQKQYNKEVEKWKNMNPDNLALKLTRDKLFSSFAKINKDTLIEILFAHENKYTETVESLLASMEPGAVEGNVEHIKEPPIQEEVVEEMKEAQRYSASQDYDEVREAKFYREEAGKYQKRREDLYKKAQQYYQKGMTEVAQFYSGLASQQTDYFERANSMAATAFLDEHFKRLQDFNTLDLHFLYVKEAIPALDMFLDRAINLLRSSKEKHSEYLQIITGRGKNSENGVSKIKPVVQARLKKRDIKFVQLNPGLLKVKVTKTTLVTNEFTSN